MQDKMTSSGDRSSEVLEDVTVCDICGDVGEEDKLAICSRCNDGAEHTYCMKVKIEEVPEGEWLCEECQAEVGIEMEKNKFGMEKGKHATSQVPTSLASNALKNKAQPRYGPLSKSISFNSSKIPKEKQLSSEVPLKPKHSKEPSFSVTKHVGPMSTHTMTSSFKKSKFCDPAHNAKTLIKPNAEETGMLDPKKMKSNRGTFPAESAFQHLNKGNNIVESSYESIAHGQGSKTLGHNEVKKPLSETAPGSITLGGIETSVGILGSDAATKAVLIPYPSRLDDKLHNPSLTLKDKHYDTVCAIRGRSVDSPTMPIDPADNALTFSSQQFSPGYEQLASTAPELNYIWQGGFELWTGGSTELCHGLQAHLSCSASPKLLELAKKFPSKIQLEELPRQNVWPSQFQDNCPTYDSIGLFFFARDIQRYENYYSKLVETVIESDLALRGNIETAELLIFASNTLSKNCQRWNMFIFLWGVLRVRRNDPLSLPSHKLAISPFQHSDSTIHEAGYNVACLEHHTGVDHVKSSSMTSSTAEQFSHISGGAHKRNVEMANWDDETNKTWERKKTKKDGKTSGNNALQQWRRKG